MSKVCVDEIDFEVVISYWDIIVSISYSQIHSKGILIMCLITAIIVNIFSIIGLWAMNFPLVTTLMVLAKFVLSAIIIFVVGLVLTLVLCLANTKWLKGRLGSHKFILNDTGFVESTLYNRSEVSWQAINKVSITQCGIVFIFSGLEVFYLPKKRVTSDHSWQDISEFFITRTSSS